MALVVQQELRAVGIAMDVRIYEFGTFFADVTKGAFGDVRAALDRRQRKPGYLPPRLCHHQPAAARRKSRPLREPRAR